MNGFPVKPRVPYHEPPKPTRPLSEIRAEDQAAWEALQHAIRAWIIQFLPGELAPGIVGEAKHEEVERWFDVGLIRLRRNPKEIDPVQPLGFQVWNGQEYEFVRRRRNG